MTRTRSTDELVKSRRRFLKLAALGSVAVVTAAVPRRGRAAGTTKKAKKAKRPVSPPPPPTANAVEAEVAKQKASLADLLKTIRGYELPPGSEPGFLFLPAKAAKHGKQPHGKGGGK